MILLLINIWLIPLIHDDDPSSVVNRFALFQEMMAKLGIEVFNEDAIKRLEKFRKLYEQKIISACKGSFILKLYIPSFGIKS